MDLLTIAALAGAGVLAGMLASIIGGAAVVVYPTLIASGLSPQFAAVSNLVALMPATMLAALSDRSQLPPFNRAFVGLIFASVVGAGAGAALLLLTPHKLFNGLVPLLLGFATLLFAFAEKISAYIRKRFGSQTSYVTMYVWRTASPRPEMPSTQSALPRPWLQTARITSSRSTMKRVILCGERSPAARIRISSPE